MKRQTYGICRTRRKSWVAEAGHRWRFFSRRERDSWGILTSKQLKMSTLRSTILQRWAIPWRRSVKSFFVSLLLIRSGFRNIMRDECHSNGISIDVIGAGVEDVGVWVLCVTRVQEPQLTGCYSFAHALRMESFRHCGKKPKDIRGVLSEEWLQRLGRAGHSWSWPYAVTGLFEGLFASPC